MHRHLGRQPGHQAQLRGRIDAAIHSAKDVPTEEDPRLRIGAYLRRARGVTLARVVGRAEAFQCVPL